MGCVRKVDRWAGKSSRMVNRVGGEIFAKTAKTPPLQSALRGGHCDPHRNPNAAHCRLHTHIMPPRLPPIETYVFYNDAARRVATIFEKWNFLIETYLRARRENLPRKIAPYGSFAAVSLLECGGLKPILPFLGGRSGAPRRYLAFMPFPLMPMWAQMMVGGIPRIALPAMPTVGAGSSQREDSPAHRPLYVYAQTTRGDARFLSQCGVLGARRGVRNAARHVATKTTCAPNRSHPRRGI